MVISFRAAPPEHVKIRNKIRSNFRKGDRWSSRDLARQSFLEFHFPNRLVARLPFYENVNIRESKEASYATLDPIGRSSSLYTYTGATSRKFKLSFHLTLPHIKDMVQGHHMNRFTWASTGFQSNESLQKLMKGEQVDSDAEPRQWEAPPILLEEDPIAGRPIGELATHEAKLEEFEERERKKKEEREGLLDDPDTYGKLVAWWTNLIRSSVLNNQKSVNQGPPIVRLTHGALYNNIPCICKSYNLSYDSKAGFQYELPMQYQVLGSWKKQYMISRRIKVELDLEEFRAGNFGDFEGNSWDQVDRDNNAGWEAIIEHSSYDPGGNRYW